MSLTLHGARSFSTWALGTKRVDVRVMPPKWRSEFPGDVPSAVILRWLQEQVDALSQGRVLEVREKLRQPVYRERLDLSGIPREVIRDTDRCVDTAYDALREPPMIQTASELLQRALALYTED